MEKIYIVKKFTRNANNGNDREDGEWFFKNKENAQRFIEKRSSKTSNNEYYIIILDVFSDFTVEA